ncbi:hypothetical protein AgCh_008003 [Apium graveolens]
MLKFGVRDDNDDYGIFSVKFSSDSKEIIAGTSDSSICVYDLGMNRLSLHFKAHMALALAGKEGSQCLQEVVTSCLPEDECHYAVYDSDFVFVENWQKSIIFIIAWCPDTAKVRSKIVSSGQIPKETRRHPA